MPDDQNNPPPEQGILQIADLLRGQVPSREDRRRRLAVAWVTELYGTVHAWNGSFIGFLKTYPGFEGSTEPDDYRRFLVELAEYQAGLDERSPAVKHALCGKLHRLYDRFDTDFAFMRDSDPARFDQLKGIVSNAYMGEDAVLGLAGSMIWSVRREYEVGYSGDLAGIPLSAELHRWHVENHDKVCHVILGYEQRSAEAVAELARLSEEAGLHFSSIDDYAENFAGGGVSLTYADNRVTTTVSNVTGPVVTGGHAEFHGDMTIISKRDPQLAAAFHDLEKVVAASGNAAASALLTSLEQEASKEKPEPGVVKQLWDGLVGAAPGVKAMAGAAAAVMALFI